MQVITKYQVTEINKFNLLLEAQKILKYCGDKKGEMSKNQSNTGKL